MAKPNLRPDHNGTQRAQFNSNKKKIYATQTVCGICGKRVDFKLKFPHPLSPCIDHIIPVAKGGDPSDISNLHTAPDIVGGIADRGRACRRYRVRSGTR